jgi:uncharacterized protein (DUF736 family)
MTVLGTFKPMRNGGWEGTVHTLTMTAKIRLVPNDDRVSENAPAFRVMLGWQRIGDAWQAQTDGKPPKDYLSVRLDDPAFPAPVRAALFADEDGAAARLLWNRFRE